MVHVVTLSRKVEGEPALGAAVQSPQLTCTAMTLAAPYPLIKPDSKAWQGMARHGEAFRILSPHERPSDCAGNHF